MWEVNEPSKWEMSSGQDSKLHKLKHQTLIRTRVGLSLSKKKKKSVDEGIYVQEKARGERAIAGGQQIPTDMQFVKKQENA